MFYLNLDLKKIGGFGPNSNSKIKFIFKLYSLTYEKAIKSYIDIKKHYSHDNILLGFGWIFG